MCPRLHAYHFWKIGLCGHTDVAVFSVNGCPSLKTDLSRPSLESLGLCFCLFVLIWNIFIGDIPGGWLLTEMV